MHTTKIQEMLALSTKKVGKGTTQLYKKVLESPETLHYALSSQDQLFEKLIQQINTQHIPVETLLRDIKDFYKHNELFILEDLFFVEQEFKEFLKDPIAFGGNKYHLPNFKQGKNMVHFLKKNNSHQGLLDVYTLPYGTFSIFLNNKALTPRDYKNIAYSNAYRHNLALNNPHTTSSPLIEYFKLEQIEIRPPKKKSPYSSPPEKKEHPPSHITPPPLQTPQKKRPTLFSSLISSLSSFFIISDSNLPSPSSQINFLRDVDISSFNSTPEPSQNSLATSPDTISVPKSSPNFPSPSLHINLLHEFDMSHSTTVHNKIYHFTKKILNYFPLVSNSPQQNIPLPSTHINLSLEQFQKNYPELHKNYFPTTHQLIYTLPHTNTKTTLHLIDPITSAQGKTITIQDKLIPFGIANNHLYYTTPAKANSIFSLHLATNKSEEIYIQKNDIEYVHTTPHGMFITDKSSNAHHLEYLLKYFHFPTKATEIIACKNAPITSCDIYNTNIIYAGQFTEEGFNGYPLIAKNYSPKSKTVLTCENSCIEQLVVCNHTIYYTGKFNLTAPDYSLKAYNLLDEESSTLFESKTPLHSLQTLGPLLLYTKKTHDYPQSTYPIHVYNTITQDQYTLQDTLPNQKHIFFMQKS